MIYETLFISLHLPARDLCEGFTAGDGDESLTRRNRTNRMMFGEIKRFKVEAINGIKHEIDRLKTKTPPKRDRSGIGSRILDPALCKEGDVKSIFTE